MKNLNEGHRARLKRKILEIKSGTALDYELLELLLCYANPRKDMKPLAKELLNKFGSISSILNADAGSLKQFKGIGDSAITLLKLINQIIIKQDFDKIEKKPIISSWTNLLHYLRSSIGHKEIEFFQVIYVDKKFMIIKEETLNIGTIDQVTAYPREIIKKALFHNATAIFIAHNHPSGVAKPSKEDISFTKKIIDALKTVDIKLIDHVIITKNDSYSFSSNGLIN